MAAALVQPNVQNVVSCITPEVDIKILNAKDQIIKNIARALMGLMGALSDKTSFIATVKELKAQLQVSTEGKIPTEAKAKEIFDRIVLKTTETLNPILPMQMINQKAIELTQINLIQAMVEADAIQYANQIAQELQPQQAEAAPINDVEKPIDSATKENPKG